MSRFAETGDRSPAFRRAHLRFIHPEVVGDFMPKRFCNHAGHILRSARSSFNWSLE